jgi:hypothetical protein
MQAWELHLGHSISQYFEITYASGHNKKRWVALMENYVSR